MNFTYNAEDHFMDLLEQIPNQRKEVFRAMFREIYARFPDHAQKNRKGFLPHVFVAHKIAEYNGWDEYKARYPLSKTKEKLESQEKILGRIFDDAGWNKRNI